jgi:DNA repair protein RecO (recombination protein O)
MKKYNTKAVVLKSVRYKDSDKIFTLFTKDYGKITAIARGVRKINSRRSGSLDTLNYATVNIHEDRLEFKNIEEVKVIESFKTLKGNLGKSAKAYYIIELVHKATGEGEHSPEIFDLLLKCLRALDRNGYSGDLFISYFEMNLMKLTGYQMSLNKCEKCQRVLDDSWGRYYFDVENGGLECERCTGNTGIEISVKTALYLQQIFDGKILREMKKSVPEIDELMKMYIGRKLERKFKSLEIEG